MIFKIAVIVFFVSNFWFLFLALQSESDVFYDYNYFNNEHTFDDIHEHATTFLINSDWNVIKDQGKSRVVLIQMYFMMTSLSTVGFGDYYPTNNFERMFGSIILLAGVAIFSYIMSKLATLIINFNKMNGDAEEN